MRPEVGDKPQRADPVRGRNVLLRHKEAGDKRHRVRIVMGTEVRIGRVRSYHNIASINESEWTIDKGSQVLCLSSSDFLDCQKLRLTNAVYDMELVFILALGFEEVESYKVISDANNYCEYKQNTQV